MFQKLKPHLKWAIPLAVIVILGLVFLIGQNPKVISATVSPEVVLISTSTGQTPVEFNLKLKSKVPVMSVSLKTLGTNTTTALKVSLAKQADGSFTGSTKIPLEWLKTPQTITFGLNINGIKTSSKLRFAITDIPVILPPDPGEEGKKTLEGIDSDHDGIRDDLQREMVFMYPNNDEVRRILRAMVKKEQDIITTTGDHEHFKGLMKEYFAFRHCYEYQVFRSQREMSDNTNGDILWYMGQNTAERKKLIEANQYKATPFGSTINFGSEACTQPQVQGQY
ncbi:MAG: hypothetical protein WC794_02965 [Candidatus Doudnabacteria bacterium]|jgi:hypothetical protein